MWQEHGHKVLVAGRDRSVMKDLAAAYPWIRYEVLSAMKENNQFPILEFWERQKKIMGLILSYKPNLVLSLMGNYTQTAFLCRVPNIVFTDSEFQRTSHRIALPFAAKIYTPSCFTKKLGKKQFYYHGYHELSYLHPQRFQADRKILEDLGSVKGYDYVVVRLSSWNTLHDVRKSGMEKSAIDFIQKLAQKIKVFVVPEGKLDPLLEKYRLTVSPAKLHDVLAFSRLVITEGNTTASEAACLGIPSVVINPHHCGYLKELDEYYGLVYRFQEYSLAVEEKIWTLLEDPNGVALFKKKQEIMLSDKIDVSSYVCQEIEAMGKILS